MPRRRKASDASKLKQGRGEGHGKDYKPFLTVREVPSLGQRNRDLGWKTGRVHHFLSKGELKCFMIYEWTPRIADIREQFPLPQVATLDIASRLGIRHPRIPGTEEFAVMTTDFLLDVLIDGKAVMVARAVKESADLGDDRVIEKLEIERTYWRELGIDWGIITPDRDFPKALSKNVIWVHSALDLNEAPCALTFEMVLQVEEFLYGQLSAQPSMAMSHIGLMADKAMGFTSGTCLWVVRHLIASQKWTVDMTKPINPSNPLLVSRGKAWQMDLQNA